jgi:hypothetical protein
MEFLRAAGGYLDTKTCQECAGVWLSNPRNRPRTVCPCCDPAHCGYVADRSFVDRRRAQRLPLWRNDLLELLERRASGAGPIAVLLFASDRPSRLMCLKPAL